MATAEATAAATMSPLRRIAGRGRTAPRRVSAPAGLLEVLRNGPVALEPAGSAGGADARLRVGVVVPQFRRGSGGHSTIANLLRGLEARGHACSVWVLDDEGRHASESEAEVAALWREFFGPLDGDVRLGLGAWAGADVALATGWQTVPSVLRLPGTGARAYLVQDHEPEFYATSAEREWAAWTYGQGLHCIAASPWLAGLLRERYGASASAFDLGVDHEHYRPHPTHRRDDLVLFYARAVTARRAVPLGVLALAELHRRRPSVEIALFGEPRELQTPFPHRHLGVLEPDRLAHAYASAAVGMVLSMTNPSLIPQEMLACGLPCVDLASDSMVATYGHDGPVTLAPFDPLALCDAIEALLDDLVLRAERSRAGTAWVAARTWDAAAGQVEAGLRAAVGLAASAGR
jgi:glycosyltransferase involved in cell wall biosynthesis